MKDFSKLTVLLIALCIVLGSSCNSTPEQKENNGFDIQFDILDNEAHKLDVSIRLYYSLSASQLEKILKQHGKYYKDKLLIPTLKSVSRNVLMEYSAGEIYNYKRQVIENEIVNKVRTAFANYDVELTKLFMSSVKLPDELRKRMEKEHVKRVIEQNK